MCGIAGIFSASDPEAARCAVQQMLAASRHRGPDASGLVTIPLAGGRLFLGQTRLSIVDLTEQSNQPMTDPQTGSCLIYNGEIYNFQELRRELLSLGFQFSSRGDTEVLLKALVSWGPDALNKLRGMFAFCFWDRPRQQVLLARDPLGIKPLYYLWRPGCFLFASEVKIMRASGLDGLSLDRDAAKSFLVYGAVAGPATILKEVVELRPGHALTVSAAGQLQSVRPFWSLAARLTTAPKADFAEAVSSVSAALHRAVRRHLIADVETAISLSGGIDSSLLAVVAAPQASALRLLTVGFPGEGSSEEGSAALTAGRIGAEQEVIRLTPDELAGQLPRALAAMDQPSVDGINTFVVSKAAASHGIKVLLSGLGGDEVFGGYTTFTKLPLLHRHQCLARQLATFALRARLPVSSQWRKVGHLRHGSDLRQLYLLQRCIRFEGMAAGLAPPDCPPAAFALPPEAWSSLETKDHSPDPFHRIASLELQFYLPNQLLKDADVFSMANSIEMRVPFLDLDVVTQAMAFTGDCHMDGRRGKRITRKLLGRLCSQARLPKRKTGFTFPWDPWLRGRLRNMLAETLSDRRLYDDAALDFEGSQQTWQAFLKGHPAASWYQVWSLFVLLKWLDRHRSFRANLRWK